MSIRLLILYLLQLAIFDGQIYGQELIFAKKAGGPGGSPDDIGNGVAVDNIGNVIVTGSMVQGAVFGSVESLEETLLLTGAFVAKYDNSGALLWVEPIGDSNNGVVGNAVDVDGEGNIYVTGYFFQQTKLGLGQTNEVTLSGSSGQIFIAKYNGEGQLVWAKGIGGENSDRGDDIVVDSEGSIYITGSIWGTTVFGQGEPTETELTSQNTDIFIAKYDNDGQLIWAQQAGGVNSDGGKSIDLDSDGNVYVAGTYFDQAVFGKGLINQTTLNDANASPFLAKYNSDGHLVWVKDVFTSGTGNIAGDIDVDVENQILFTGSFFGTVTLEVGTSFEEQLIGIDGYEIAVIKYNSDGELLWAKGVRGVSNDRGEAISTDLLGNVYVAGSFIDNIEFEIGDEISQTLNSSGNADFFLAKYSPSGKFIWVTSAFGEGNEQALSVCNDEVGNSYLTGSISGATLFNEGELQETSLIADGASDIFIAKFRYSDDEEQIVGLENNWSANILSYPNPVIDYLNISTGSGQFGSQLNIYDCLGKLKVKLINVPSGEIFTIDFSSYSAGVYFLQVVTDEGQHTIRVNKY